MDKKPPPTVRNKAALITGAFQSMRMSAVVAKREKAAAIEAQIPPSRKQRRELKRKMEKLKIPQVKQAGKPKTSLILDSLTKITEETAKLYPPESPDEKTS